MLFEATQFVALRYSGHRPLTGRRVSVIQATGRLTALLSGRGMGKQRTPSIFPRADRGPLPQWAWPTPAPAPRGPLHHHPASTQAGHVPHSASSATLTGSCRPDPRPLPPSAPPTQPVTTIGLAHNPPQGHPPQEGFPEPSSPKKLNQESVTITQRNVFQGIDSSSRGLQAGPQGRADVAPA